MGKIQKAIISLSDKTGILELAKTLNENYDYLLPFLNNFNQGEDLIFLGF